MARDKSSKNDWKRLKKFEIENEKLRKEVSRLRKQAKSKFIDELELKSERKKEGRPAKLPTCENCGNPEINFISIERKDGNFEIRICRSCQHRTEMKLKK